MLRLTSSILLAAAAATALAPLSAQTIAGTVRGDGRPVVGVTVRVLELDRSQRTGAAGEFTFANIPPGTYRVFVAASGFASSTDTVRVESGTARADFALVHSAVELREIVVTASAVPHTTNDSYQPTASRGRAALLASPGISFAEKIADLPGVAVRGMSSAPSRPVLRGMTDNELLVLENGLRMGDLATFDPAHGTPIEAAAVSQIDVVRGPATILYGPSTIGGVVNILTDIVPAIADHPKSGTAVIAGNSVNDGLSAYASSVASSGSQAFGVSGGIMRGSDVGIPSGTYEDPGTGAVFALDRMPHTFAHSGEAGAGYSVQGDFGSIGIGGKRYEMNYGIPGVPPNENFADVPPTTSRIAQKRNTVELRGAFATGTALARQIRLNASYNDYNHTEFPTGQDDFSVFEDVATHFHKRTVNGVLQLQHAAGTRLQGTLGVWSNVERMTIAGDEPLGPNSLTTGYAGYAFEELVVTSRTRIQAGARYDWNRIQTNPDPASTDSVFRDLLETRNANAVTASLGVVHRISDGVTGSLNVARSFRAPTVQELFADGLDAPSGTYTIGTPSLGPETGLGIDASLKGSFTRLEFELTPFANYVSHYMYGLLRGDTIENFPVRQFAATDARLVGFEASVNAEVLPHVALRASTDYVNAEDTRSHEPLPFTPPLRGLLRATYADGRRTGIIEWRGAAKQSRLGEGDTPTSGYGIVNAGFGIRLVRGRVVNHVSVHCDNIFDRAYRDHLSVIKDFIPQPGRGFRIAYEVLY